MVRKRGHFGEYRTYACGCVSSVSVHFCASLKSSYRVILYFMSCGSYFVIDLHTVRPNVIVCFSKYFKVVVHMSIHTVTCYSSEQCLVSDRYRNDQYTAK